MPRSVFAGLPDRLTGRSRRVAGAIGAIAAAALAIGLIVGLGLPGSSQGASQPAKSSGSTTVQRRDLVATDTVSGTLSYAEPHTVFNRLSGTVTSLPAVGQVIKTGRTLYQVNGSPVVLFDGTTPAYRDLTSGVSSGSDVEQLNRNLVKLGFDPSHQIAVNNTWQAATTTAVNSWQGSLGEAQTGTVTLGQIVFLPGPQRVSSISTVLGSTGGSGAASGAAASGSTATGASTTPVTPAPEFVSLTTTAAPAVSPASSATALASCPAGSAKAPGSRSCCPTSPSPSAGASAKTAAPAPTPAACQTTSSSAQTVAALIALLKAETLELGKSKATPTGATGGATGGGTGTSGSPAGSSARGGGGSTLGAASTGSAGGGSAGGSSAGGGSASGGSAGGGSAGGGSAGGGATASAGSAASSATAILGTTSTRLVVTVSLDATKQSEATVGEPVTVQLPNGNTVDGKITQVSPVAQTASSSSTSTAAGGASSSTPSATVPITITLSGRHPDGGLDQAAVSVNFQQQVANNVLSVPVTALLATAGGGYAVQEAQAPHQLIPVTTGLFAAGYVQISGPQIYSGLQVTESQG